MKTTDVFALGSCYIDTNVSDYPFESTGIPPEVELVGSGYEVVPGGSAVNFCLMLQQLGLTTAFLGVAGTDIPGDLLETLLKQQGVKPILIRRADLQTNIGFNLTNPKGQHIMLVAGTASDSLEPQIVLPRLATSLSDAKMLYLGGCFKLKSFPDAFPKVVAMAREHHTLVVVDHGRIRPDIGNYMIEAVRRLVLDADYYLPSREEFCRLWDVPDIESGLYLINQKAPRLTVVVKDGGNGAFYWSEGKSHHIPPIKIPQVAHATGAGDSFNAGVIASLAQGASLARAVERGCEIAAKKISSRSK